jgi:glycosyltransferase involved in cell wall biosynthesis
MARPGILVIHNRYLEPGGEDSVVNAEIALLRSKGHRVLQYARHNREIAQFSNARKALLPFTTIWDYESYRELRSLIRQERPALAHCHNLFPLLSPAVYYACAAEGVPVVQTMHNYRLVCPGGNFFHHGESCNTCQGSLSKAALHGCYHDSRLQTGIVALMLGAHRSLGTWQKMVDTYIAPSKFCRATLNQHGIAANKIIVKPHFAPKILPQTTGLGEHAIFVGRLSEEKGILQLLKAWREVARVPLMIVGSGPLELRARQLAQDSALANVSFAGQLTHDETLRRIRNARFIVAPSRCYETFGISVLEAMACAVPAIVPRTGALHELVSDRRTGFHVDVDDREQFSAAIRRAWSHPLETREMGRAAHHRCLEHYSADNNYNKLTAIYDATLNACEGVPLPKSKLAASRKNLRPPITVPEATSITPALVPQPSIDAASFHAD